MDFELRSESQFEAKGHQGDMGKILEQITTNDYYFNELLRAGDFLQPQFSTGTEGKSASHPIEEYVLASAEPHNWNPYIVDFGITEDQLSPFQISKDGSTSGGPQLGDEELQEKFPGIGTGEAAFYDHLEGSVANFMANHELQLSQSDIEMHEPLFGDIIPSEAQVVETLPDDWMNWVDWEKMDEQLSKEEMVKNTRLLAERIVDGAWMESLAQDMKMEEQRFEGSELSEMTNEEISCCQVSFDWGEKKKGRKTRTRQAVKRMATRLPTLRLRKDVRPFDFRRNGKDFYRMHK